MLMRFFRSFFIDRAGAALIIVTLILGAALALQVPAMGIFLTDEVGVSPLTLSVFFASSAAVSILVSQSLGALADRGVDKSRLLLWCNIAGVLGCLVFAYWRGFVGLLLASWLFFSFAAASLPLLFAIGREYVDNLGRAADQFSANLRAQIALAWVIGPPLAFLLKAQFGFQVLFAITALVFVLLTLCAWLWVPRTQGTPKGLQQSPPVALWKNQGLIRLTLCFTALFTANHMYIIGMPLWLAKETQINGDYAGYLMGLAAALEIPVMLLTGTFAARIGKKVLVLIAVVAAALFFGGLLVVESLWALLALQIFNALFIGIAAVIGISYFQDLASKQQLGGSTALYSNSIRTGGIIGGAATGITAQWMGFSGVFWVCLGLICLSLWLLTRVPDVRTGVALESTS